MNSADLTISRKNNSAGAGIDRLNAIIKSARDIMRKDKGLNGDLDRLPQLTWIMFLKFLDDVEKIREAESALADKPYVSVISSPYRWRDWAAKPNGITGDDLIAFVNNDEAVGPDGKRGLGLLAYLRALQSQNGHDRRDVVASIFRGVSNRMLNGYLLREVINRVNEIDFASSKNRYDLGHLYESLLKQLRDAAGDSGEFYTPRPVVQFMVKMINPKLGETVLDPAAGTGGFLVETFIHLSKECKSAEDLEQLQKNTLFGIEAKSLPYLLCQMNLLLHGLEYPNIDPLNALRFSLREIAEKDRVDVILTNPPFGGEEERGILGNFPDDRQTAETELLFLQLIMRKLRRKKGDQNGGRCAIILPNGNGLSGGGVSERIRKDILTEFNLHTVVRLPPGVFAPYTPIPTNILFFEHGAKTKEVWYYQLSIPEGRKQYSKTKPIQYDEFLPLIQWWHDRSENENAWKVPIEAILNNNCNLEIQNPNIKESLESIPIQEVMQRLINNTQRMSELLSEIEKSLVKYEKE